MADFYYTDANRQPAGPIPLEEIRAMHERGELAEGALIAEVGADNWQEASAFFGAGPSPAGAPAMAPPVSPGAIPRNDRFEALAGWSFGLGLASWACIGILPAIPGVILGHMALSRMKRDGNSNGAAKVLAIIGLVASYLNLAIIPLFVLLGLGFGLLSAFVP
ncbi:MAG: DUF4190 domain-containing protein [Phycisphaerales bacterium]|nr:DUF4190 domain-containing protein [Phycisphaerales bacterium]